MPSIITQRAVHCLLQIRAVVGLHNKILWLTGAENTATRVAYNIMLSQDMLYNLFQ